MEDIGEKNPPGPTNFYPPDLGGKVGRKERKGELNVLYVSFFPFLFYFILLWKLACL